MFRVARTVEEVATDSDARQAGVGLGAAPHSLDPFSPRFSPTSDSSVREWDRHPYFIINVTLSSAEAAVTRACGISLPH
jgi:hypothetical protein